MNNSLGIIIVVLLIAILTSLMMESPANSFMSNNPLYVDCGSPYDIIIEDVDNIRNLRENLDTLGRFKHDKNNNRSKRFRSN